MKMMKTIEELKLLKLQEIQIGLLFENLQIKRTQFFSIMLRLKKLKL